MRSYKVPIVDPDLDVSPSERNALRTLNQRPGDKSGLTSRVAKPK